MVLSCIKGKILAAEHIIISTHSSPDGDAIGSETALALAIKKLNKNVLIVNQDEVPAAFKFLEKHVEFKNPNIISNMDSALIIALDVSDVLKMGPDVGTFIDSIHNKEIVFVSHHKPTKVESDCPYIISEAASSTGEIIYSLIKDELNVKIDTKTAEAIYTAIVSDTRSFRYSRTTAYSHRIAAELLELGIDAEGIQTKVYGSNTPGQIRVLGYMLQNFKQSKSKKIAYSFIPMDILNNNKTSAQDTKSFINQLLTIKGVEVAVLFRQDTENKIKVSIRSKGAYSMD